MNYEVTLQKVIKIVANKLGIEEERIEEDSLIIEDLQADSLDIVEMIMEIEEQFGITIDDNEINKLQTIKDIVEYIENKRQKI